MRPIEEMLGERFGVAMGLAFGAENIVDPQIKAGDPKFADYQSNVSMALAKRIGRPPREVANDIIRHLKIDDVAEPPTVAGPGFINLRLKKTWLAEALLAAFSPAMGDARAGVEKTATAQTIVIDYSGPNVAKQMHVGHLRSTIIGDTVARVLEFLGHEVIRQNHLGDFGTQFGKLIHWMREKGIADSNAELTIVDLDRYYKESNDSFKNDPAFAEQSRKAVVELQSGGKDAVALWERMRAATRAHYHEIYDLLNVTLTDDHARGESFFGPRLPAIVERVKTTLEMGGEGPVSLHSGTADDEDSPVPHPAPDVASDLPETEGAADRVREAAEPVVIEKPFAAYSNGAFCVFLPGYLDRDKGPLPLLLQKSDGGYPYSATDLAALYFRVREEKKTADEQRPLQKDWRADRVVYFTNLPQALHFAMVFDAFRAAQWDIHPRTGAKVSLEHASFGSVLGEDGKMFRTRSGDSVKLKDLLTEAIERAAKVDAERGAQLSEDKRKIVDRAVGIGAVKYADLRQDRATDYIFSWDRMLSFQGNTGPYLQMQYTRVRSIFRKGDITAEAVWRAGGPLVLEHADELALAKKLLAFGSVVESVGRDLRPHYLCTYLYELSGTFSRFFENCSVLKAEREDLKASRLLLCEMVAQVLRIGLHNLLGIEVLEEM